MANDSKLIRAFGFNSLSGWGFVATQAVALLTPPDAGFNSLSGWGFVATISCGAVILDGAGFNSLSGWGFVATPTSPTPGWMERVSTA